MRKRVSLLYNNIYDSETIPHTLYCDPCRIQLGLNTADSASEHLYNHILRVFQAIPSMVSKFYIAHEWSTCDANNLFPAVLHWFCMGAQSEIQASVVQYWFYRNGSTSQHQSYGIQPLYINQEAIKA